MQCAKGDRITRTLHSDFHDSPARIAPCDEYTQHTYTGKNRLYPSTGSTVLSTFQLEHAGCRWFICPSIGHRLARRWNQSTPFGAFLDPVADKLMVAVALALLIERFDTLILTLPALVIIGREIVISALREWMAEMGKRGMVAVSWVGKLKTTLQMVAILVLLAFPPGHEIALLGVVVLYAAAALTLWSMAQYLKAAWPHLSRSM